jgi:hypothetical protein
MYCGKKSPMKSKEGQRWLCKRDKEDSKLQSRLQEETLDGAGHRAGNSGKDNQGIRTTT